MKLNMFKVILISMSVICLNNNAANYYDHEQNIVDTIILNAERHLLITNNKMITLQSLNAYIESNDFKSLGSKSSYNIAQLIDFDQKNNPEIIHLCKTIIESLEKKFQLNGQHLFLNILSNGWVNLIKLFIHAGYDVNGFYGEDTPLIYICKGIEYGKKMDQKPDFKTHLQNNAFYTVNLLIYYGADTLKKDIYGNTPLYYAMKTKSDAAQAIQNSISKPVLLKKYNPEITVTKTSKNKYTINYYGNIIVLEQRNMFSLLFRCISKCHRKLIEQLVKEGVSLNIKNEQGDTLLIAFIKQGHVNGVKLLLDNNANPVQTNNKYVTPFSIALMSLYQAKTTDASKVCLDIIELLIDNRNHLVNFIDADGNEKEDFNQLMIAAYNQDKILLETLLKVKSNPNLQNSDGNTALMIAILIPNANSRIISILTSVTDLSIKNKSNKTALDIAKETKNSYAIRVLELFLNNKK